MFIGQNMPMETEEKVCLIALSQSHHLGPILFERLLTRFGSAKAVFQYPPHVLARVPGMDIRRAQAIHRKEAMAEATTLWKAHESVQIRIIASCEADYPERLKHIYGAPMLLYLRGDVNLNATKIVSIVGTRTATSYGKRAVETLLDGLRKHTPLIVSGLAYGIDIYVHRTALALGFPTLAVLAGGLDRIYPAAHRADAQAMLKQGGLLSEHALKTQPEAYRFVTRNRIIAGISDATIVVEAGEKSGALITARYANDYNREVFAVAGDIHAPYSVGCHQLIKTHQAHLLTRSSDLTDALRWSEPASRPAPSLRQLSGLTAEENRIVQAIGQRPIHIDTLSTQTKMPAYQVSAMLLQLELKQIVKALPGNMFQRVRC